MPSYLHPRSRSTSTLFTTTLAVSFLVVALPHVLPCPVDQRRYADSASTKSKKHVVEKEQAGDLSKGTEMVTSQAAEQTAKTRECPVPKPQGVLGNLFGFRPSERRAPVEVVVMPRKDRLSTSKEDVP